MRNHICITITLSIILIHNTYSSIITADFSNNDYGWNQGKGLWVTQTNLNGLSLNNPYQYLDPSGAAPRRGVITWTSHPDWIGDYGSQGITKIGFYARNASNTGDPLFLRAAFGNTLNPMSGTWFVSENFQLLTVDDGWTWIEMDIGSTDTMVKASSAMEMGSPGTASFSEVYANIAAIRIISQGSAFSAIAQDHSGDAYIDSIALIPEPQTVGLIILSSLLLIMIRNTNNSQACLESDKIKIKSSIIGDSFNKKTPFL